MNCLITMYLCCQLLGDKIEGYQKKKYVCKLLFMFLLGNDINFGYQEAVNLLSSIKFTEKQIVSNLTMTVSCFTIIPCMYMYTLHIHVHDTLYMHLYMYTLHMSIIHLHVHVHVYVYSRS